VLDRPAVVHADAAGNLQRHLFAARVGRGACAAVIGKVTESGRYVARHRGETVMDVDLEFLTAGVRYSRPYLLPKPERASEEELQDAYWPSPRRQWIRG